LAISLLKSWEGLVVQETTSAKVNGVNITDGLTDLAVSTATITGVSIGPNTKDGGIYTGIYTTSDGNVYAFASTIGSAANTPSVQNGNFKLVAYGTAYASETVGPDGLAVSVPSLTSLAITMATGSQQALTLGANSKSQVLSLTGSSSDDTIVIAGTQGTTAAYDFSQGGTDKIYFTGKNSVDLSEAKVAGSSSTGTLSFVAGSKIGNDKAVAVLGATSTTMSVSGDGAAEKIVISLLGDTEQKLELLSSSGKVDVVGSATNSGTIAGFKLGELVGGTFTFTASSIANKFEIGTVSGGTGTINLGGKDTKVTDNIEAKFGLVNGGTVTLGSSTGVNLNIDTIQSGKFTVTTTGGSGAVITTDVTGGSLVLAGGLTLNAGSKLNKAEVAADGKTMTGNSSQTIKGGVIAAGKSFTFSGLGSDVIELKTLADNATANIRGGNDTVSVSSFGNGSSLVLQQTTTAQYLTLGQGSNISNGLLTTNNAMVTAAGEATFVGTVSGASTVVGSTGDDSFLLTLNNNDGVATLTGGAGDDIFAVTVGSSSKGATITDFGWANASGEASDAAKGADVILVTDTTPATMSAIIRQGNNILFGSSLVSASISANADAFARIGLSESGAKLYKIGEKGATLFESEEAVSVEPQSVTGGTLFNASSQAHAYIDAASGANTVQGFAAYTGDNDKVASILNGNNVTVDNAKLSTASDGSVVLSDAKGANSIELSGVKAGEIIKMGDTKTDTQAVFLAATGNNAMTQDQYDLLSEKDGVIIGQTNSVIDLGATDATTVKADSDMFKNVGAIKGSSVGGSLLDAGTSAAALEAAGKDDTIDGGTGSVGNLLTSYASDTTTFNYHTGIGKDTIDGFVFGAGDGADVIDLGNTALTTDLINGASGKVYFGDTVSGNSYELNNGSDQAIVSYDKGVVNGVTTEGGAILVDTSADGKANLAYENGVNIVMGDADGASTLTVGSGDTVKADRDGEASGVNWNSPILTFNVGTIDGSTSSMTAMNGQGDYADKVIASTVVGADKLVSLCGGLGAGNFADSADDTLVASGKGNNEIYVGSAMGDDVIQNVNSGDKITFLNTKISDFADDINEIVKVTSTGFTATFEDGASITGTFADGVTSNKVTNLVFHFDSDGTGAANDYRWDGQSLVAVTTTA
jgi:hypothetical protein